jgi:hypothetical protein
LTAVLIEERLELGMGWLIDDILSERCWQGGISEAFQERCPRGKYRSSDPCVAAGHVIGRLLDLSHVGCRACVADLSADHYGPGNGPGSCR